MTNARDKANIPVLNFQSKGIDDNADATAITIDSSERIGIGTTSMDGKLHVQSNSAGSVTANTNANLGVFEANSNSGISLLAPDNATSHIYFGSPSENRYAQIKSAYDNNSLDIGTNKSGGFLRFATDSFSERIRILSDGKMGLGTTTPAGVVGTDNVLEIAGSSNPGLVINDTGQAEKYAFHALATKLNMYYGTTAFFTFDASNSNLGIGTASPSQKLHVNGHIVGNSLNIPSNTSSPPSGVTIHKPVNNTMAFRTNSSERMRLTDTGLGIGTTVSGDFNSQARNLVIGGGSGDTGMTIYSGSSSGDTGNIFFADGTSGSDQVRGGITYNHGDNSMNFRTNDGANRIYISSAGLVGIGTASPTHKLSVSGQVSMTGIESTYTQQSFISSNNSNSYTLQVRATSANPASQYITDVSFTAASPDNSAAKFFQMRDSTTARVNINSDGDLQNHDNSYGGISDERIKQNIIDAGSQWEDIKNIRIRKYKKKHDVIQYGEENAPNEIGVISQELETVSPGLIKEDKADSSHAELHEDFTGDNPQNVKYVKYSILYMKSVKALQEAMERIETLEARITALETTTP